MIQTKEYYENYLKEFNPTLIIWEGVQWDLITLQLKKVVHLLFGGQSWSWKSVFILQLLFQMLFLTNPNTLKLILVDPLRVSFSNFKSLPHLLTPIANTAWEAIKALNVMIATSRERYDFLEKVGFEDIYSYNEALAKWQIPYKDDDGLKVIVPLEQIPESHFESVKTVNYELWKPIPQLVVFIDEFNALMLDEEFWGKNPADASTPVLKDLIGTAEQARKAWILIVLGTQKIDATTVPTKIRWNLKTRICLKVLSSASSATILWDSVTNKTQGATLAWYGDGLVFNEDLAVSEAIRFQSAYVSEHDMLDLINWFIITYWKNSFDYISVNESYAKSSEDLEPLPISYTMYKDGLPDLVIVKDSIFQSVPYQKLLSEIIRNPFTWDDKTVQLRYPSIKSADFKVIKQRLLDSWVLWLNSQIWEDGEPDTSKPWYLWLNLNLKGLDIVLSHPNVWFTRDQKDTWDPSNPYYQSYMMKLVLVALNKTYIEAAYTLSYDIREYITD